MRTRWTATTAAPAWKREALLRVLPTVAGTPPRLFAATVVSRSRRGTGKATRARTRTGTRVRRRRRRRRRTIGRRLPARVPLSTPPSLSVAAEAPPAPPWRARGYPSVLKRAQSCRCSGVAATRYLRGGAEGGRRVCLPPGPTGQYPPPHARAGTAAAAEMSRMPPRARTRPGKRRRKKRSAPARARPTRPHPWSPLPSRRRRRPRPTPPRPPSNSHLCS
mmetsp:Transcript_34881/g.87386  ORF Transcript_34881/g.87386 Transcript_34881/m.87386 type:complete len:220 (+) Transcript_34881:925-1584(+)